MQFFVLQNCLVKFFERVESIVAQQLPLVAPSSEVDKLHDTTVLVSPQGSCDDVHVIIGDYSVAVLVLLDVMSDVIVVGIELIGPRD